MDPQTDMQYTSEIDLGPVDFSVGPAAFGQTVSNLITIGTAGESPAGQYTTPQTVNDYIDHVGDIETVIIVLDYTFSYKDVSVFKAPSAP